MKLVVEVSCDNAAFEDLDEVSRILRGLASRLVGAPMRPIEGVLRDANGNTVGHFKLSEEP